MTTNTTTELRAIMTRAHKLTAATVNHYPTADYSATLGEALRIAWEEARRGRPETVAELWTEIDTAEYIAHVARSVYNRRDALQAPNGGYIANPFAWLEDKRADEIADGLTAVTHDAWIIADEKASIFTDTDAEPSETLHQIAWRAVIAAAVRINRAENRNPSAEKNGCVDITAEPIAERIAPNPEQAAIIADEVERAAHDKTDAAIIAGLAIGLTYREIAAAVGINFGNVSKRVARIRDRL